MTKMQRFVLLEHDWPTPHFDLMLEQSDTLFTWRLAEPLRAGEQIGEHIADHRLAYLDYEGPISGGRGTVRRVERGECEWVSSVEPCKVTLRSESMAGTLTATRASSNQWTLNWQPIGGTNLTHSP